MEKYAKKLSLLPLSNWSTDNRKFVRFVIVRKGDSRMTLIVDTVSFNGYGCNAVRIVSSA